MVSVDMNFCGVCKVVCIGNAGLQDPTLVRLDVDTKLSKQLKVGVLVGVN